MARNVNEVLSEMETVQTRIKCSAPLINLVYEGLYYHPDSLSEDDCNALWLIGKIIDELAEKDMALRDEVWDAVNGKKEGKK